MGQFYKVYPVRYYIIARNFQPSPALLIAKSLQRKLFGYSRTAGHAVSSHFRIAFSAITDNAFSRRTCIPFSEEGMAFGHRAALNCWDLIEIEPVKLIIIYYNITSFYGSEKLYVHSISLHGNS